MKFRRAIRTDLAALNDIIEPYLGPAFNWPPINFNAEFEFAETWAFEVDDEIKAFVCVRNAFEAWEISVLATRLSDRRKGLMEKLLSATIEHYGRQRHFWLEVHESNLGAQAFYEKIGFKKEGRRGGYYSDGSSALLYTLPSLA